MAETSELFDEIAGHYDRWSSLLSAAGIRAWHGLALERLELKAGLAVLDVGCGTGTVTRKIAGAVGPSGRVVGLDPSPGMLEVARHDSGAVNQAPITWVQGHGEAMPFADAEFDRVTAQFSVRNMEQWRKGISDMARVLRPRGLLVILDVVQPVTTLGALAMQSLKTVTDALKSPELEPYRWLSRSIRHAPTGEELTQALDSVGIELISRHYWLGDLVMVVAGRRKLPAPRKPEPLDPVIVWATDGSVSAERGAQWLTRHMVPGTVVHVVTVCPTVHDDAAVAATDREAWIRARDESAKLIAPDRFTVRSTVLDGEPGPSLVEYARAVGASLIVVGEKGRRAAAERIMGGVAAYVTRHAECPVALIRLGNQA